MLKNKAATGERASWQLFSELPINEQGGLSQDGVGPKNFAENQSASPFNNDFFD
jgi:hypothetical protein